MELKTFPIGSLQTNCYMVWEDGSDTCILIDPGYEPELLLEQVRLQRKTLEAILLTHGHFDHVGGVRQLAADTDCQVYLCDKELSLPSMMTSGGLYYTHTYEDGDSISLAGLTFRVLHTPGHTPGSVCLIAEDVMFSGDTLFAGSCGRVDFPGSSVEDMRTSLARLQAIEEDYRVLPGHCEATTLSREKAYNPYLKGML